MRLVIASRKSDLARLQAIQVRDALLEKNPDLKIEFHFRESLGDRELSNPLWQMPEKGVFTEDFVKGLEDGEFDLVVHSWKDLPTEKRVKTEVVATLPRADLRDVLLIRKEVLSQNLKEWRILSSSPRRIYFLTGAWGKLAPSTACKNLSFHSVRGNIPTRLSKLAAGEGEGLLVAKAALDRLLATTEDEFAEARQTLRSVLDRCLCLVLPASVQPPAPAQGALAIEINKDRDDLRKLLMSVHCPDTFSNVQWERSQLSVFGGGCHLKLGALAQTRRGIQLRRVMGSPPKGHAVHESWIVRQIKHHPQRLQLCLLKSEDLFNAEDLQIGIEGEALYVAHHRALREALPTSTQFVWAAGLKTWENLAARGIWVNGCDESLGQDRPSMDLLIGKKLDWKKLTHDRFEKSEMTAVPTYRLKERETLDLGLEDKILKGEVFFWRSGTLFEAALKRWPLIKNAVHCAGLGQTRTTLEKHLGPLTENQIFLDEADWRMFYGAPHE